MPIQVRTCRMHLRLATFVACAIFCFVTTALAQQPAAKIQSYVELPPANTIGLSLSMDGSTVLVWCQGPWSHSGGIESPPVNSDPPACVQVVSSNGTVFAGRFWKGISERVFVWPRGGQVREIAKIHGLDYCLVRFVSNDGTMVIWTESSIKTGAKLFRWTQAGGTKDLGSTGGGAVRAVSADGSVIVGYTEARIGAGRGFRWTAQGGFQDFPAMDHPFSISADGTVIVGMKADHVIRWTQAGGAQDLGALRINGQSVDLANLTIGGAAADGNVIVGWMSMQDHDNNWKVDRAFLWTQSGGGQVLGTADSRLRGVSADGTLVAGDFGLKHSYIGFVSPLADLVKRSQTIEKEGQQQAQAQKAAQEEENARNAAIQEDQQARYDKVVITGRPIQIYSLAGDLEDEGRPDLALNLYQALIDKFPDDPYAAKAVEKKEALRAAQQQAQDSGGQQVAANSSSPQAIEACIQQCSTTLNSCKANAQTQHDSAVAKGLVGLLSKNAGMVGGAGTDSQNADSAKSACNDDYNSCSAACQ